MLWEAVVVIIAGASSEAAASLARHAAAALLDKLLERLEAQRASFFDSGAVSRPALRAVVAAALRAFVAEDIASALATACVRPRALRPLVSTGFVLTLRVCVPWRGREQA